MAWSTRELAELAGTTVNTVRHYHHLGLLDEPDRRHNGYKQYEVRHLVALLRIRRLVDLGVPLSQVEHVSTDAVSASQALRRIDADLREQIERLQAARDEIAAILEASAPADAPAGFPGIASRLSEARSSMIHIYSRLFDDDALADLRGMVENEDEALAREIDRLPPDADEAAKRPLIDRIAEEIIRHTIEHPWLGDPLAAVTTAESIATQALRDALLELFNPAQIEVFVRASALAQERRAAPSSDA